MTIRISAGASNDLLCAVQWYDAHLQGLGREFVEEFERIEDLIARQPRVFAREEFASSDQEIRQAQLRRFPCRVIFRLTADSVTIVAIVHAKRRPKFWARRLNEEE